MENRIFNYYYECRFEQKCSFVCCYRGVWIFKKEINRINLNIVGIKKYLSKDKQKRLEKFKNRFYQKSGDKVFSKTRTWNSTCIFLTDKGECAVHSYALENNLFWADFKFEACTIFPFEIDFEKKIINLIDHRWKFLPCLKDSLEDRKKAGLQPIIYSMKEILIHKLGIEFWENLERRYHDCQTKLIQK